MARNTKKRKSKWLTIAVVLILLLFILGGVGIMVYPILAANYAESVRSEIQTSYEEIIKEVDTSEIDAIRAAAIKYNADLAAGVLTPLEFEENGYYEQLVLPTVIWSRAVFLSAEQIPMQLFPHIPAWRKVLCSPTSNCWILVIFSK